MMYILIKPLFTINRKYYIYILLAISISAFLGLEILFPSLPGITQSFGVSKQLSQTLITSYLISYGVSQLVYGPFSDYYGRRVMLLIGFTLYLCGALLCSTSKSIDGFILARFIQGFGAGAPASLSRILLRDLYENRQMAKASSLITIGIATFSALSPAMGGAIQEFFNYQGNVWLMIIYGIFTLLLVVFLLPETHTPQTNRTLILSNYFSACKAILYNKIFMINTICAGFALGLFIAYGIINPFVLQIQYKLTPSVYGLLTIIIAIGETIGAIINSKFVMKIGMRSMNLIAYCLVITSSLILMFASEFNVTSIPTILFSCFLSTTCVGIVLPNLAANAFSQFKEKIGLTGALYGFIQISITALLTFWISHYHSNTVESLSIIFFSIGVSSLLLQYGAYKNKQVTQQHS